MKIGIVSDSYKDKNFEITKLTGEILESLGVETVYPDTRTEHNVRSQQANPASWADVDLAISIGGDGTFLYTCNEIYKHRIPIIGINKGSLGFFTEIHASELESSLRRLAEGDYKIKHRMMLEVAVFDENGKDKYKDFALNDAVLYRGDISRIIPCELSINSNYIQTILSDGLIVAAPSGSTGYALSSGGPIVDPSIELMLVTPISPHSLTNRTYVINSEDVVEVSIRDNYPYEPKLSVDGREGVQISSSDKIKIRKASDNLQIAYLEQQRFFSTLPEKLNARGSN